MVEVEGKKAYNQSICQKDMIIKTMKARVYHGQKNTLQDLSGRK